MMNKDLFSDGISHIDPDAVERLLRIEKELAIKKQARKRAWVKVILIAAALALLIGAVMLVIPYIPRTYDLNYDQCAPNLHDVVYTKDNVWIYYTTESGQIKREYVRLPSSEENVLMTWKHVNGVGDDVTITCTTQTEPLVNDTAVHFGDFLPWKPTESKTVTATLSGQITSYENYDALIESLQKTLAKYVGIDPEQVKILIDGEQIVLPDGTCGNLRFSHDLQQGFTATYAVVGSELKITVTMTNISLEDIEFTGSWGEFVPSAILLMDNTAAITHADYAITEEYQKYILAPGQSREMTYTFPIPENAVCGKYDLFVTFGEASFTFENAVQVVKFGYDYTGEDEFAQFMKTYGFNSWIPEDFRTAVGRLSYNGVGLFNYMTEADVEWLEGYNGFIYDSEQFHYSATKYSKDGEMRFENYFEAQALPDGMTLPYGITPDDTPVEALCKMGYTQEQARKIFNERKNAAVSINPLSSVLTVFLKFNTTSVDLVYEYGEQKMEICFDEANGSFLQFRVMSQGSYDLPQYTDIELSFPETSVALPFAIKERLLSVIGNCEYVGQVECDVPYIVFACMEHDYHSTVNYCGSHFHIKSIAYDPAGADKAFVETLMYALNACKLSNGYNTLLYYNGNIYGHSAKVDEQYGNEKMGEGFITITQENILLSLNPRNLVDVNCYVQDDYLLLTNGMCFERIVADSYNLRVTFSRVRSEDRTVTLTKQQSAQLAQMLSRAEWVDATIDRDYDSACTINGVSYLYDSNQGIFRGNDETLVLSRLDCLALDAILNESNGIYFEQDSIISVDSPDDDLVHYATLSQQHKEQILAILNDGNWENGTPGVKSGDFNFIIDTPDTRYELNFNSQTGLILCDGYYLNVSNADKNIIDEIFRGYTVEMPCV